MHQLPAATGAGCVSGGSMPARCRRCAPSPTSSPLLPTITCSTSGRCIKRALGRSCLDRQRCPSRRVMNGITATSSSPQRADIFWLDQDFAVNHKSGDGTQWAISPENLGGSFITVPAAVAGPGPTPAGRLDVFGVGTDFAMYRRSFDGIQWSVGWEDLGGTFISAPGAYERPNHMIDLFGVGLDFAMYHRFFVGSKEGAWERLGGTFSSTASAVSFNVGR